MKDLPAPLLAPLLAVHQVLPALGIVQLLHLQLQKTTSSTASTAAGSAPASMTAVVTVSLSPYLTAAFSFTENITFMHTHTTIDMNIYENLYLPIIY